MKRIAISCLLLATAPAWAAVSPPGRTSPALSASPGEEAAFMLTGDGVHIYQCKQVDANGRWGWVFTAPDATLYEGSRTVGTLQVPNLWESTADRSSVAGVVRATQPAGSSNLPWAALNAQPIGESGMFAGVTSIQRVNTQGGAAPANGCGPGNDGAESRVNFRADYYFYKRRGAA
jgi:hypothetical protein